MKPSGLKTNIFLDSGDPGETQEALDMLGFLDGQTTNPSLIAKQFNNQESTTNTLSDTELLKTYKSIVQKISNLIPQGSVSIEVYADKDTSADDMFSQGKEMFSWIPNAHIKFPTTTAGLEAAQRTVHEGMRVNMTLVFTQEQAAAVYVATRNAGQGDVYVSPFIGRLDDRGENGMDLVKNIATMYMHGHHHVSSLAASIRSLDHFYGAIVSGADIITCPLTILKAWKNDGMNIPDSSYRYEAGDLDAITYQTLDLDQEWRSYTIQHDLTDTGLQKFADDWNALLK